MCLKISLNDKAMRANLLLAWVVRFITVNFLFFFYHEQENEVMNRWQTRKRKLLREGKWPLCMAIWPSQVLSGRKVKSCLMRTEGKRLPKFFLPSTVLSFLSFSPSLSWKKEKKFLNFLNFRCAAVLIQSRKRRIRAGLDSSSSSLPPSSSSLLTSSAKVGEKSSWKKQLQVHLGRNPLSSCFNKSHSKPKKTGIHFISRPTAGLRRAGE